MAFRYSPLQGTKSGSPSIRCCRFTRREGSFVLMCRLVVTDACLVTRLRRRCGLLVVVEEAEDVVVGEAFAAAEEVELDGEGEAGDFAA
jgi:hypothetical protein